ncbi:FMN-binding domain protein [Desulfitobacterium hafniense DP7]|uniref:FMN-binding domain protein n=1 Tax=Desulfitobacterium hafniense DP7 TaxID=537010 RepID=G9XLW6_DESHA|nr:FMN-binding domain protein [Desulfitobacterium hafniense DP7]
MMKRNGWKAAALSLSLIALLWMGTGCGASSTAQKEAAGQKEGSGQTEDAGSKKGTADTVSYKDGTYEGVGQGIHGEVKVSVTVAGGKLSEVKVIEHQETEGVGSVAAEILPGKILEAQGTEVETVSGATVTSAAIMDGVEKALEQAK